MEKGKVFIIATPIGNLDDISKRAIETLKEIDILFCEDTRETGKLLKELEIKKKTISNNEQSEIKNIEKFIKFLEDGKNVGIVSDRGTPIISDPGYLLAKSAVENNFEIISIPGPSAVIAALVASGLEPQPFTFYGFLNSKKEKRKKQLEKLKKVDHTLIFYESPRRIEATLEELLEVFGNRKICISREITKLYEEHIRGDIKKILEEKIQIKGEVVLLVEGNKEKAEYSEEEIKEYIDFLISEGENTKKAFIKASEELNISKNKIYKIYHNL